MRKFNIPGQPTEQPHSGLARHDKRRLLFMVVGLVLVIIALAYSNFRRAGYEQAERDELPLDDIVMTEEIHLPTFDAASIERLVADADPLDRVVLESEALDALMPDTRTLTSRHFEAMQSEELTAERVAAIVSDPPAHRLRPFRARGFIDSVRTRRRASSNDVEHIGRLILDDQSVAYFVVLEAPENAGYVRVDGLFMKVYSDEDDLRPGEWREGPLLVGPSAIRSYRAFGPVDEPHWGLYRAVEDAVLIPRNEGDSPRVILEPPFEAYWHMMAYARDLPEDAIDWDAAPELDQVLMAKLVDEPGLWRGQPLRIPISRVQDGRVVGAGENPARIERFTQGWLGNWAWPNVVRFRYPRAATNVQLRDFAYGRGFFLHNSAYESKGRGLRVAPMIILTDMKRFETKSDPIFQKLGMVFGALVVGLIGLFVLLLVRDKRRASALQADLARRRKARRDGLGNATPTNV